MLHQMMTKAQFFFDTDRGALRQISVLKPLKSTSEILAKYLRPPKNSLLSCLNGSLACVQSKKRFMFPHFLTQSPLKKVIKPLIGQIAIKRTRRCA